MQRKPLGSKINWTDPIANGLVGAWRFNFERNQVVEAVANRQIVTQDGTFSRVRNGFGSAGSFGTGAGANDNLNYGDVLPRTLLKPFSVFAVVKPAGTGTQTIVCRSGEMFGIYAAYEHVLYWGNTPNAFTAFRSDTVTAQNATSAGIYPAGGTYRVCVTFDGVTMRLFVNGKLAASAAGSVSISLDSPKFVVASEWYRTTNVFDAPWKGSLYDLRVWNRQLKTPQIASLATDPWRMYRRKPPTLRGLNLSGAVSSTIPVVSNFVPALPGPRQPSDSVQFDVTVSDGLPFANISINFLFTGLITEEGAYDGADFAALYSGISTVSAITNGYRFVIKRRGGWPNSPQLKVRAITSSGKVNT